LTPNVSFSLLGGFTAKLFESINVKSVFLGKVFQLRAQRVWLSCRCECKQTRHCKDNDNKPSFLRIAIISHSEADFDEERAPNDTPNVECDKPSMGWLEHGGKLKRKTI
jgi:hypothetical protein